MKNLLIDIGNSDIKSAEGTLSGIRISGLKRFPYEKKSFKKDFIEFINKTNVSSGIKNIGISSLDSKNDLFIKSAFRKFTGRDPFFIKINSRLPVKISYSPTLGTDRICSAAAAERIFPGGNVLIIDFGTATTYTFVSKGILKGGFITPGIATAINSLHEKAKLIKVHPVFPDKLINNNTELNIQSGVLYQSLYFTEGAVAEMKKEYKDLKVIATGGFCGLIGKKTDQFDVVDKELVLKGINIIIQYNEDNN
ncbi:MAG: type III pantothenate kinase [Bacteroidetes bacterium]|nr:type III pantothenate kinase [Bacteroidota bacterium]